MGSIIDAVKGIGLHTLAIDPEILIAVPRAQRPEECFVNSFNVVSGLMCSTGHRVPNTAKFCPECGLASARMRSVALPATVAWCGEGSGHTYETFLALLRQTTGRGEFVLFWNHGDCTSGLRVRDGVVTECDVLFTLIAKDD